MKSFPQFLAAALAAILLPSCGETRREVLERYSESYEAMAREIASLADALPSTPVAATKPLAPLPVYKDKLDKASSNIGILMHEQLADPAADVNGAGALDLRLSNGIATVFHWIGEKDGPRSDAKVAPSFEEELKRVLAFRYLGVVKLDLYRAPAATSETEFNPGIATGNVHLVDRESGEVVFSGPFTATNDEKVGAKWKEGEDRQAAISAWLRSNLWSRAREAVAETLRQGTGAEIGL